MVRFVTIRRRGGEAIPINPEMVCYMRQIGALTTIAMADGGSFRVEVPSGELVKAFIKGGDSVELEEPEKAPPAGLAPAPEALGASGAQVPTVGAATPAAEPVEGEGDLTEEEEAELKGRAQRGQEAEPGQKPPNQHASRK